MRSWQAALVVRHRGRRPWRHAGHRNVSKRPAAAEHIRERNNVGNWHIVSFQYGSAIRSLSESSGRKGAAFTELDS